MRFQACIGLTICSVLTLAGLLSAQDSRPKATLPEPIADLGVILKGDRASHDFMISNEGTAVLEIVEVRSECGCAVATFDRSIAPHASGKIHVVVDTSSFNEYSSKGFTVYTNDRANPMISLTVRAQVEAAIVVKPGYARYLVVHGEELEGEIVQTLYSQLGKPLEIVGVDSPFPYLSVSFREARDDERLPAVKSRQWRIAMALSTQAPVGPLSGAVTVRTTDPRQRLVEIPVSGAVRPAVVVTPPVANLGQIELKQPLKRMLTVKNLATAPLHVTGVDSSLEGIDATIETLEDGRAYRVRITVKPEMSKGKFHGRLTLHTDSPTTPVIEVEVVGAVL